MSLSAEEWFNSFKIEFEKFENEEDLFGELSEEYYDIPEKFTETISNPEWTTIIHYFLRKLAKKYNYYQKAEYPIKIFDNKKGKVDFVWFEPKQKEPSILIEHENNPNFIDIFKSENLKFLKTDAKLKILITYNIKEGQSAFSNLRELIKATSDIKKDEEFLFIIGNQEKEGIEMIWNKYIFLNGELKS
ncbi:MAG: hypothetical protein WA139_04620 [Candidatus Aenigmatarchaeota archaeon]